MCFYKINHKWSKYYAAIICAIILGLYFIDANNVQIYLFIVKLAESIPLFLELIMCEHEAINKYEIIKFINCFVFTHY